MVCENVRTYNCNGAKNKIFSIYFLISLTVEIDWVLYDEERWLKIGSDKTYFGIINWLKK